MDAMVHGSPWDPPLDVRENVSRYVDEVARVLRPGAVWIYITYRQPHFVTPYLSRPKCWEVQAHTLNDGQGTFAYYAYRMAKFHDGAEAS